jgi:hypothetical protein
MLEEAQGAERPLLYGVTAYRSRNAGYPAPPAQIRT